MRKKYICIETEKLITKVDLSEIIYIEKSGRKAMAVTENEVFSWYRTRAQLEEDVDDRFLCCHRSYIINMDKITRMEKRKIRMEGGFELYFGKESFRRAMLIFREYVSGEKNDKNND